MGLTESGLGARGSVVEHLPDDRVPTSESRVPSPEPRYVELRAHTAFSFGDGACTPEALVERAAALGYGSLGITDGADLGGVVRFAAACQAHDVRPVVGVELVVDGMPLALLARDAAGFRALGALVTASRAGHVAEWRRDDAGASAGAAPRGWPNVAWGVVAERAAAAPDGLVLLTGPASGRLAGRVKRGRLADAERLLAEYRELFGEWVAVEVQLHHTGRREEALAGALIELAERAGARWVVTGDPRWLDAAGRRAHDVLTALRHEVTVDDAADLGLLLPNDTWALEDPRVVAERWAGRDAGVRESAVIAEACAFSLGWVRPPLPDFPVPDGMTLDGYLRDRTYAGARERWGERMTEKHVAQLEHELKVIAGLGFAGFFLTMWDAVREARARNIMCQGRGSAANSAVTYCLGVTAVDPVANGLLFERFLSPARVDGVTEAPDIDLDVEHDRREELLDYVYETYGRDRAAITAVTQLYSAPTAIQDVCRAYGVPAETAFALSKRCHHSEVAPGVEKLRAGLAAEHGLDVTTPRGEAMLEAMLAFHDLPRMRSTHPGGFVLSSAPLGSYCPVEPTTMGRTIIQLDKDDLDLAGIPKYDFLGLGSLAAVRRAFDVVEQCDPQKVRPALYTIPQDDAATFDLIARGDTIGLFQIESRAQISSLVNTKPERMYDIVVQVALIRPGPIQAKFVHPYTERRRGRQDVTYAHPALEPILARTMGIPIFQEQAMSLSMALAGYTAAEADELRRTMGHQRKARRLAAALERLAARMVERGVAPDVAVGIAEDLTSFANYGFPESHAWSFALIAYATAWLKAHHPTAFYIGLLNAQPMGFYSVATLVHDARHHGVEVRLPDVVLGDALCTAEPSAASAGGWAMRVGWKFVRGVGDRALDALIAARAERPFASIADVVRRARLGRGEANALARAQAFASFEPERRRAGWEALGVVGDTLPLAPAGRGSDVGTRVSNTFPTPESRRPSPDDGFVPAPLGRVDSVFADYQALGLSTAGHPAERFAAWAARVGAVDTARLQTLTPGERVIVVGLVTVRQRPVSAKGTVFLLLEDARGSANVIVWPKLYDAYHETIVFSPFLAVYGQVERDGGLISVIGRRFLALGAEEAGLGGGAEAAPAELLRHQARSFR